ncbi:MAG: ABC transporter permease [Parvibaculaceae bacterium]
MTVATAERHEGSPGREIWRSHRLLAQCVGVIALGVALSLLWPELQRWPAEWIVPLREWLTQFFAWLGNEAAIGPVKVRDVTRGLSWLLSWPLYWTEAVLYRGFQDVGLPPLPWIVLVAGVGLFGHWVGGLKLGLFGAACTAYLAIFGLWTDAMRTLAIVLVAVPLAAGTGLLLGIWATRSKRAEATLTSLFDLMQATPHMAYLAPVVILFGFGQVPAMLATVIFAMPPMARCTILGIRTVPSEVVEAARMSGCTPSQLLWKVELPAAHQTLMLGFNQVVMQTLAMAVIASLVGASGLGQRLLFSLQQLMIGKATEQGIAIVLIAVVLDRLTQAYAYREPHRVVPGTSLWIRHPHLILFLGIAAAGIVLAQILPSVHTLPRGMTVSLGGTIDVAVRWISKNAYEYIQPVRDWITVSLLLPLRDFYLWLPWVVTIGLIATLARHLGGWRLSLFTVALMSVILLSGFWVPAMMTLYLVTAAVIICVLIGVPLGIWCARKPRVARVVMSICDTLQTFPSFIYLIPVIMLFKVGDLSNIIAILAYASVPAIRYTYLGLKRVPTVTVEAAEAQGCTKLQRLWKVELPIAMPEIMLGINQTIMMALAMTAITALIGSRDLGQEIYKALPGAETGRGILAGLGIAIIGIIADRLIGAWARRRKAELGITS